MEVDRVAHEWTALYERRKQKRCYAPMPPPRSPPIFFGKPRMSNPRHERIVHLVRDTQRVTGLGIGTSHQTRVFWRRTPVALEQWGRYEAKFRARVEEWLALIHQHGVHKHWYHEEFGGARATAERNLEEIEREMQQL